MVNHGITANWQYQQAYNRALSTYMEALELTDRKLKVVFNIYNPMLGRP